MAEELPALQAINHYDQTKNINQSRLTVVMCIKINVHINYDIKGTEYWKAKLVLKIHIIITAGMINLVITVTLYKHQESNLPRTLTRNTQNRTGQKEQ